MVLRCTGLRMAGVLILGVMALALASRPVSAQGQAAASPPATTYKLSGLAFGDYYVFPQNHQANFHWQQGFWLRRAYFTFDQTFSAKISMRWRLDVNSNGAMTSATLTPYLKDAWIRWAYVGRQQLTIGIQPTASIEFIDTFWGLRHVEKTPTDLYKFDSTRDFGISLAGPINQAGTVKYVAQFGNDSSQNSETDKYKAVRLAARYETNPGFVVEGFFGHFSRPLAANRTTWKGFAGYQHRTGRVGFQYLYQVRKPPTNTTQADVKVRAISGFGVYHLVPRKASVFARVDRFIDPIPDGKIDYLPIDQREAFTVAIAGLEYYVIPTFRISPNIEWVKYDRPAAGAKPRDDVATRVTFYWTW
jgi:hypothetical protein